ncbi:DUF3800 domain-containing protein [Pseudovibrio sp. FO-BEG1]|uniref:DUF3800 domain-containing protein n=1 Tax=Pseudovibrio sp. (strain FO-BEG1) TaxID=911045 RepID=UPI0005A07B37|nr:DUF3800 domain-containing protein [Pseudovibrio sp. FO-BEG1]
MSYEIYCDETMPDLLQSQKSQFRFLLIGGLWVASDHRERIKLDVTGLRKKYSVWGEMKWRKISPANRDFYFELVNLFHSYNSNIRFRCIVIDSSKVDAELFHDGDDELGFYKFYYQLIHHWILRREKYSIFCDLKTNKSNRRLVDLRTCLVNANKESEIANVQSLRSKEVVLLQLVDVLLGAVQSRYNNSEITGVAKNEIATRIEELFFCKRKICASPWWEQKFNVFQLNMRGG